MHVEYHVVIDYYSQIPGISSGCQLLITHTEVAAKWTSMVLQVNKHNFCLVVTEFQLVHIRPMTYISDTVLYAQSCNIDSPIFELYVKLDIISTEVIVKSLTSYYLCKWYGMQ